MKKIILLIWFSPILSNSNFEILNLPQNIYAFTVNEYSFNDNLNDNIYSLSFSKYPANISLLNFSYNKKFIFSFLDYGILNNQIDNDILNSFSSYEFFLEYIFKRNIKNYTLLIKPNIVHSKIDFLTSTAVFCNLSFLYNDNDLSLAANIENMGYIINDYISNDNFLNMHYTISGLKRFPLKNLELGFNLNYYKSFNNLQYSFSINKKISDKVLLLFDYSSIKRSLNSNHIFTNIFAGMSAGLIMINKDYNIGLGIKSLSDAGYSYCLSFDFK